MQSGSPRLILVIRTHCKLTWQRTEFHRSNEDVMVSVDRNFLHGGSSCGKSCSRLGVTMGAGWNGCSISTNEPFWQGLDAVALGGLQLGTNELIGEDLGAIIRLDAS